MENSRSTEELLHQPRPTQKWWALLLGFALVFGLLQYGWSEARDTALERWVVDQATVKPAVWLVNTLTPKVAAIADESRIRATGGGLNIRNGCEGTEVLFILAAAFVAARMRWRTRLVGFFGGLALLFVLNQIRIVVLFYAFRSDHHLFDLLHTTIAPLFMILLVFLYFYVWLHRDAAQTAQPA